MGSRLNLHKILKAICPNCYFQPPESIKLKYPCIIYNKSYQKIIHADNLPYRHDNRYTVTVIDRDPDSTLPDRVAKLKSCNFDRSYATEGLYHTVYVIYY